MLRGNRLVGQPGSCYERHAMHPTRPIRVRRTEHRLLPNPGRVLARPHTAASRQVFGNGHSQARQLLDRLLAIPEPQVETLLQEARRRFASRHQDLDLIFEHDFQIAAADLPDDARPSQARRRLIGAYFTMEYAIESAALFNPSIVAAPDQSGLPAGACRFVMSLRAVGEGHLSSIEFRGGVIDGDAGIVLDEPSPFLQTGLRSNPMFSRRHVRAKALELGADPRVCGTLLDELPDDFHAEDLETVVERLDPTDRAMTFETVKLLRLVTASNYEVAFPARAPISERVLVPAGPRETQGLEDARFVRFADDAGVRYYATYTAFDGFSILPQLIETPDFLRFRISTLDGHFARDKGLALFPRRVNGRFAMLSRHDQASLHLMYSDDVRTWRDGTPLLAPKQPWEIVRIGNCGSPLETPEGWLVLTHGVGPVRQYAIGAVLLDLEDPGRVIGELPDPLLEPDASEREGYVPNVVYSCGSMIHGGRLVLPYGYADLGTRFALVDLADLLSRLKASRP